MLKKLKNMFKKSKRSEKVATPKESDRGAMINSLFSTFPTQKFSLKNLAAASGGADREGRYATREVVEQMVAKGSVERLSSDMYRLSSSHLPSYEGVVDMLSSGSLFVKVPDMERDVYISQRNTKNALHGDVVRLLLTRKTRGESPVGEIIEIVKRNDKNYVGVVELSKSYAFVRVDSRKVPVDVFVPLKGDMKLVNHQKVSVHIDEWAEGSKSPVGHIVAVFGMQGENNAEMHAILAEYDLPYIFDERVEQAAQMIPTDLTEAEFAKRRDMRDVTTFTIDPADAKDFDDALSIRKMGEGVWEIGVHIADVTHYVTPGSIVETEAESRATSVYLVDRTVPMLPERLSNELCSLRPDEEKLAFSAVFTMDENGTISDQWLGRTVIRSNRRFAYEDAQKVIETGQGDLKEEILILNSIAQKMREARFKNGSVGFERGEAKFQLDENGKPLGVYFKVQKEANQLIEEFMLLANRKVAEFVGKKNGKGANAERTMVYRVHDEPNVEKLAKFKNFILKFGYHWAPGLQKGKEIAREMNRLMGMVKGKSEENLISTLAIRSMAKAYYTTQNAGHYGLAFSYYTHFTSPIRRYPDMMVHRLLANYLDGGKSPSRELYDQLCEHSSDMEVRAAEAERASIKYKMVEYMMDKVGVEFDGHISGVTEWGIYVELDETHIEGMVSLRDMQDDYYYFNEADYAVVGHSSGRTFTLGDAVKVRVARADLARKQLDFQLADPVHDIPREKRRDDRGRGGDARARGGDNRGKGGSSRGRSGEGRAKSDPNKASAGEGHEKSGESRERSGAGRARSGSSRGRSGGNRAKKSEDSGQSEQ